MKQETIEDIFGELGFRVFWATENHWADVKVYQISGYDQGQPMFVNEDWQCLPNDMGTDPAKAEVYLEGFIKWDGCSELEQGKPHWCGPAGFAMHCALLKYLYHRAFELMGRGSPDEPWPDLSDLAVMPAVPVNPA